MGLTFIVGDATNPPQRPAVIAHVVNDLGRWGAGFALTLGHEHPFALASYRRWAASSGSGELGMALGRVRVDAVRRDLYVAHLCAQRGLRSLHNPHPLDLDALGQALAALADALPGSTLPIYMPRIGCGLSGGSWAEVEPLVVEHLARRCAVVVVDPPSAQ